MGEYVLKRILSALISLIIAFMSVSNGVVAFANELSDNGLNSFAEDLASMVRRYDCELDNVSDNIFTAEHFYGSGSNVSFYEKYPELSPGDFELKRLIIKSEHKIDTQGAIECISGYRDLYILQYDSVTATEKAYDYYKNSNRIIYVEPDGIAFAQEEFGDKIDGVIDEVEDFIDDNDDIPSTGDSYNIREKLVSWASEKIGFQDIKDELADKIKDDYIQVAVLDSGVDTDHEVFEGRLIESDVNYSSSGDKNSVEDDYGHGTHVAGILVENTLSNVKIKPYKVLNSQGRGSRGLIALAIDLAVEEGADIVNMSLSSEGEFQTLTDSVNNAVEKGVNVVVAAGNSKKDLSKNYYSPACVPAAFTVSATTKINTLASYSNYNGPIDIAAPGDDIESSYTDNSYAKLSGTSMATPQVSAGLAIVYSAFPEKTAQEAQEMLCEYAIKLKENEGENKFGAGLLYLKYILDGMPTAPEPIFSVDSCTFSQSFSLTISCPEKDAKILYVISDDEDIVSINFLNGEIYEKNLTISLDTTIFAVAYVPGKKFSSIVKVEYTRANNSEADLYDISKTGYIQGYFGAETDLIIPSKIRGITVKGVYSNAFKDNETIRTVTLPDTATRIFNEAFMNCTALESVKGKGITQVEKNAFTNSTISVFPFEQLTTISNNAFEGCKNLKDVNLANVTTIQANAFKNASGLESLNCDKLTTLGVGAFAGSDVKAVDFENLTTVSSNAFENCTSLSTASFPYAKTISQNAFFNCSSLESISVPVAKNIGANCFKGCSLKKVFLDRAEIIGNFAFADNKTLTVASLPKATSIGTYVFNGCSELQVASMPSLKVLTNYSFSNCPKLLMLWLPSVETVNRGALDNSSVEYLRFDKVQTIMSLPKTIKGVLAPSTLTKITVSNENAYTIYGYTGTYAEQYANENSNVTFSPVPAIVYNSEDKVNVDDTYIMVYAMGFNCKYQWYKNDTLSNEGGTLIEGATYYCYEPSRKDDAAAYYCVITSDDGVNSNTIISKYIKNAPEYRSVDFTEYNALKAEYEALDRSLYKADSLEKLDNLFEIDVSGLTLAQQDILDNHIEEIRRSFEALAVKYLLCDLNGDSRISVLDARLALKAVVGNYTLDDTQKLAADVNGDGKVSVADTRLILKEVLK